MDPLKILLVDDSKSARYALRLQLQRHGVSVETADSAESALQLIEKQPPDAVLMDHTMPGMNGFEALEILKANQATAGIPVVMCTSHEEPSYDTQARHKGALDILPKSGAPQKLPEVLDEIRSVLATTQGSAAPQTTEAGDLLTVSADTLLPGTAEMDAALPAPMSMATPEGLSKQDIETLIDIRVAERIERIERQLDARVGSILDAMLGTRLEQILPDRLDLALAPRLAQLKQDLSKDLTASLDDRISACLAAERDHADGQTAEISRERIQRATMELLYEQLPDMVSRQISAEPAMIMHLVERQVREIEDAKSDDPSLLSRLIEEVNPVIDARATDIAKKAAQTAAGEALQSLAAAGDARTEAMKSPAAAGSYLASIGAAAVGIGAAVVVYFLLS